jgi:hypothetical protein
MKRLAEEPVIVVVKDEFPVMVTASDVKAIVFLSVYFPVSAFPFMAWMLDLIHRRGDLIPIISPSFPQLAQFCPASFRLRYYPDDSPRAVSCSDHGYRVGHAEIPSPSPSPSSSPPNVGWATDILPTARWMKPRPVLRFCSRRSPTSPLRSPT